MSGTLTPPSTMMGSQFVDNTSGAILPTHGRNVIETFAGLVRAASSAVAGTTYTVVLTDRGCYIDFTSASAVAITIPLNASVAFPVDTMIHFIQAGAGQLGIGGPSAGTAGGTAGGVTMRSATLTFTTRAQWSRVTVHKRGTDEWRIEGDLS